MSCVSCKGRFNEGYLTALVAERIPTSALRPTKQAKSTRTSRGAFINECGAGESVNPTEKNSHFSTCELLAQTAQ